MNNPKFMFETFEEWAETMGIDKSHPSWEAFQMVWNAARWPSSILDQLAKQFED